MALPAQQNNHLETSENLATGEHLGTPELTAGSEHRSLPVPPARPMQMPINPVERRKRMHKSLGARASELADATRDEAEKLYDEARTRASDLVDTSRREAERLYNEARMRASEGYERLSDKAQDASDQTRAVARFVRNEYPLQTVAVLAGAAFFAGMLLRMWRSNA